MKFSKKNILVTGLAVSLAATMLIGGGTFAYLQGKTDEVKNEFKTNTVSVDLKETTGEDYNIIPGTSQSKDPKVTVTNTVDAYVYVEVTDQTEGLVTYEIAEGWTKLNGYENVYYREVAEDATVKEFSVLKDDTVYYSAALENSNMLDKNGKLKEGIELTFKAYAIQKDPFTDAAGAYQMRNAVYTADAGEAKQALNDGNSIVLKDDIDFNDYEEKTQYSSLYVSKKTVTIDLNGKTITGRSKSGYFNTIKAANGAVITINGDGKVIGGSAATSSSSNNAIEVTTKGKVIINGGTYTVGPDKNNQGNSVVFSNGGDVVINDGFFYTDTAYNGTYFVLNKQDGSKGSITCYGGTFVNCDPSKTGTEPKGESDNFVAEGYGVISKKIDDDTTWYTVVKKIDNQDDLVAALDEGKPVNLFSDITLSNTNDIQKLANSDINLNGNSLTISGATTIHVRENDKMTIENGTFEYNGSNNTVISLYSGADVTIKNVEINTKATINVEAGSNPATLDIIDSKITSYDNYCVSTNASDPQTGKDVKINIKNSELTTKDTRDENCDSTAILFNVPGTLNIEDSTITGERQAVIVRCGTATITDSELICTGEFTGTNNSYDNADTWRSGNEVHTAVLVVGNYTNNSSYPHDATCTLSGDITLKFSKDINRPLIYAAACNGHTTTITGIDADEVTQRPGKNSTITINN